MKQNQSKRPSHTVYLVEGEGDKAHWTKVGAASTHDDNEGFNITLSALPLNGRLVIRKPKTEQDLD